ncbi:hypothetical protein N864_14430 [Intrasporangium chromatireducens Q5-1]|uniref:Uncharacterized protein n=1 Tax=Intrasporangium chromatireducens Q5-1 TaxID=584657 RepID=W9GSM2_9MICO|nr:hypothetical protein [Intrasporangium chromatireducens]EWT06899.1 hypothetical protein N864_14430 [Intrasporangium chromatireducens Q5-1]
MDFAASTTAALDGLLTREGFMAGQGGDTEVIYCAGHDELSDRFPRLPQANAQPRGLGCCVDLVIDQYEPGVQVLLEGEPLARTLRALGLDEAAQSIDEIGSMPLDPALETLVEVLPQLFRASKP